MALAPSRKKAPLLPPPPDEKPNADGTQVAPIVNPAGAGSPSQQQQQQLLLQQQQQQQPQQEKLKRIGDWIFGETLGQGSFGKVKLAHHCKTKEKVAIKIVDKSGIANVEDVERVYRETFILTTLKHVNIIKLFEVLDTPKSIMAVMEYAGGGELFSYVSSKHRLTEVESCRLFQQIVAGVEYCHRAKVIHRDLKLENILLDKNGLVKIADFGLSNSIKFGQKMDTSCGTPSYTCPEQIMGKKYVGNPADIWSLGVILFAMISGFLPFESTSIPALFKKIKHRLYRAPDYISKEAQDLISSMLTVDPEKRSTIAELRNHPWMLMEYTSLADTIEQMKTVTPEMVSEARAACMAVGEDGGGSGGGSGGTGAGGGTGANGQNTTQQQQQQGQQQRTKYGATNNNNTTSSQQQQQSSQQQQQQQQQSSSNQQQQQSSHKSGSKTEIIDSDSSTSTTITTGGEMDEKDEMKDPSHHHSHHSNSGNSSTNYTSGNNGTPSISISITSSNGNNITNQNPSSTNSTSTNAQRPPRERATSVSVPSSNGISSSTSTAGNNMAMSPHSHSHSHSPHSIHSVGGGSTKPGTAKSSFRPSVTANGSLTASSTGVNGRSASPTTPNGGVGVSSPNSAGGAMKQRAASVFEKLSSSTTGMRSSPDSSPGGYSSSILNSPNSHNNPHSSASPTTPTQRYPRFATSSTPGGSPTGGGSIMSDGVRFPPISGGAGGGTSPIPGEIGGGGNSTQPTGVKRLGESKGSNPSSTGATSTTVSRRRPSEFTSVPSYMQPTENAQNHLLATEREEREKQEEGGTGGTGGTRMRGRSNSSIVGNSSSSHMTNSSSNLNVTSGNNKPSRNGGVHLTDVSESSSDREPSHLSVPVSRGGAGVIKTPRSRELTSGNTPAYMLETNSSRQRGGSKTTQDI